MTSCDLVMVFGLEDEDRSCTYAGFSLPMPLICFIHLFSKLGIDLVSRKDDHPQEKLWIPFSKCNPSSTTKVWDGANPLE